MHSVSFSDYIQTMLFDQFQHEFRPVIPAFFPSFGKVGRPVDVIVRVAKPIDISKEGHDGADEKPEPACDKDSF